MKLLLVAATAAEIEPLRMFLRQHAPFDGQVKMLVTGVGMVATAFSMGAELSANTYDLAINAGIGGAFDHSVPLGTVFHVNRDCFSELGAQDGPGFIPIEDMGFGDSREQAIETPHLTHYFSSLPQASGITVNTVHGCEDRIRDTRQRLQPAVESMEGAAFFYSCRQKGLPSAQLRAVSNYVERRNRAAWNIPLAIESLNNELIQLIKNIL